MPPSFTLHPASYRDPSGFLFWHNHVLYRQVNQVYQADYAQLTESGLYGHLVEKGQLLPHEVIHSNLTGSPDWYTTLRPQRIGLITYPYEWSFDMLRDAALLTLSLAKTALDYGMVLKDATPYNIQFHEGRMLLMDSLSFERLDATQPWIGYRQFCEQFAAPLSLMHYLKTPLSPLLLAYPEGIPLPLASRMLPWKSRFRIGAYLHLHLHARYAQKAGPAAGRPVRFTKEKLLHIFNSLESLVRSFRLHHKAVWSDYYEEAERRPDYLQQKKEVIERWMASLPHLRSAIDLGANEGVFSELAARRNIFTVSADADHHSINQLYKKTREAGITNLVPLVADLAHPSPAIGVNNTERAALTERVHTDLVMALAVIHHLAIGRHMPFTAMATFFKKLGRYLIVEYVPKEDEKIKAMLAQKKDIYAWYTQPAFEAAFGEHYRFLQSGTVGASGRTLYLMQAHEA